MNKLETITQLLVNELTDFEANVKRLENGLQRAEDLRVKFDLAPIDNLVSELKSFQQKETEDREAYVIKLDRKLENAKIYPKWAVITFIITLFSSKAYYWKHMLWMPGLPVPIKLFLAPIEIIGMFVKPIALMIRLFANITAGHVIVLSLISLIFVLKTVWVAPVSVIFTIFISVIEVLVVAIQAYIFTLLSALYFGQALEEEHH